MSGASDFVIEKGIPIPKGREPYNSYPFAQMKIGDSFLVSQSSADNWRATHERIRAAASKHGMDHKKKFTVRKVAEGLRCWRIL